MDTHVWTQHRETGGYWRCPVGALDEMRDKGWEPSEAPPEYDPTTAERRAWRARQAAETTAAPAAETKPTKAARSGESERSRP